MFTDAAAEFLVGQGIDKSIVNQGRDLMKTPMGKMIEPLLMQMQGVVQNPGPGVFK